MLQQALDFREENEAIFALLDTLEDQDWNRKTQFKDWTINDVLAHLHMGNCAADLSLQDTEAFYTFMQGFAQARKQGNGLLASTRAWLDGTQGRALLHRWRDFAYEMADRFGGADPKKRVKWVGPDMSVRSSITARLMETWAHTQAVYDVLGRQPHAADRIKNVVVIGINTFGWTFTNRGLAVPADQPYVRLTGPSGATWEWNQPDQHKLETLENRIEGSAVEFCQVVTQVRNIADTSLKVVGETARSWMAIAQCFAGPPENPPAPGSRFTQV